MKTIKTLEGVRHDSKQRAAEKTHNVVWTPQPKQIKVMQRKEYEVLFGGAAGGGKSDYLVVEALRQVDIPHYKAVIFRRTYDELNELIEKTLKIYKKVYPNAKFKMSPKPTWTFPSGAKILFRAMQYEKDKKKYQGQAYDFIGFDELTHFTYSMYSYLWSRNRANGPGTRVYIRATANPGGVGHSWVKSRFIDIAPPMTPKSYKQEILRPDGEKIEIERNRIFVPSSVFDNKKLLENDPQYLASLAMLPKKEREALLYGDWHSFSGQVFSEFVDDPEHYKDRMYTHVIDPFVIPDNWRIYRSYDFGYARPFSVAWWAVDTRGCLYRIRELYGSNGEPNVGLKWTPHKQAEEIKKIEDKYYKGRRIIGVADPSIWDSSRGESVAAAFEKHGIYFDPADNERIAGKMQLHYRFAFDEQGLPMMYIFNTCRDFIRTVPALVYDEHDVEDVDTTSEDHIYDEARYMAMENPIPPRDNKIEPKPYDPLSISDKRNDHTFLNI
ncbi:MAG: terminase family protein [Clostridiales bacterium]|nr:terminase family protein [Clostridiales bacterium]